MQLFLFLINIYLYRKTDQQERERGIEDKRESSPLPLDYKYRSTWRFITERQGIGGESDHPVVFW